MEDLTNRGLIILNGQAGDTAGTLGCERTIVVTGVARGGTTMLAQTLDRLGLFMGDFRDPSDLADLAILSALLESDMRSLQGIIEDRNRRFAEWGFKIPNLHSFLPATEARRFRNPRYVVVLRDPLAIARRNELAVRLDAAAAIRQAGEDIAKLTSYICALTAPVLVISYEKALQNAASVIETMTAFCGLAPSDQQRAAAVAAIVPNDAAYIYAREYATQGEFRGQIDGVLGNVLQGWCCYRNSADAVTVEVLAGETLIGAYPSRCYRKDLQDAGIHLGAHGFEIDLAAFNLRSSTLISVRPRGYTRALPNSGQSVAELRNRMTGL